MSLNKINSQKINELITEYNLSDIQVVKYKEMLVILTKISSESLENNWKALNSILSEYTEEFIDTIFARWNVYIIYLLEEEVTKEVKYKIENNTFFARKIIEDRYTLDLSDENIQKLIEKHITFNDIKLINSSQTSDEYSSESKVYSELKESNDIDESKIDEILNLLEEGIKNEI